MSKRETLTFLFGAGLSVPYLNVTTDSITKRILSGEDVWKDTDMKYYLNQGLTNSNHQQWIEKICGLLQRLKQECDAYFAEKLHRWTNYEDLYYLCATIATGQNPLLGPMKERILPDIAGLLEFDNDGRAEKETLETLANGATYYIHDVVCALLTEASKKQNELRWPFLEGALTDTTFAKINLFTLNHDCLLEKYLGNNEIEYSGGFGEPISVEDDCVRYFDSKLLRAGDEKVRLIKLHGSLDWREFKDGVVKCVPSKNGPNENLKDFDRPLILTGTLNKASGYLRSPFLELHSIFFDELKTTDALVIAGYGFGDEEINKRIGEWAKDRNRKAIFIGPDPKNNIFINNKKFEEAWNSMNLLGLKEDVPKAQEEYHTASIQSVAECAEKVSWKNILEKLEG